jgi:nucleoside-diphosphate-sugar epimerase
LPTNPKKWREVQRKRETTPQPKQKTKQSMAARTTSNLKRILVLGGNGYVGQNICHAALQSNNFLVRSLNRSGKPDSSSLPPHLSTSLSQVEWIKGDVFDKSAREDAMSDVDAVFSCIGAFGSNEFMERICGDATIEAIRTAKEKGIAQFGFVSSAQVYEGSVGLKLPKSVPMHGYFQGKYKAEKELLNAYPDGHVIVRPGFIYGPRNVGPLGVLPLQAIGAPISFVGTQMGPLSGLIQSLPFVGKECSSMVPVESVARAMVESISREDGSGIILDADQIRKFQVLD